MTSIVDLVVAHIVAKWDPAITPVPKIASLINVPAEKQLGESVLVEPLGHRVDEVNEVYGNEYDTLGIRIYTNQSDTRLMNFGNEVERIFANYVVGGFTRSRITGTTDVSERQRKSYLLIKTLELTRLGVYRGEPIMGVAPTDPSWRDPTYVTIADESSELANSVRHLNITEAEKHTPKIHELGGDRHTQTSPLTLSQALTVQNDVVITGDLTVQGTQTIIDTVTMQIEDNIITLNQDEGGAGITEGSAGIEIDRGSLSKAQFLFDEASDKFIGKLVSGSLVPFDMANLLVGGTEVINSSRKVFPGGGAYGLTAAGIVADDKVADSDKVDGSHVLSSKIDASSDVTYVEWTNLDINAHRHYRIHCEFQNAYSGGVVFYLFVNGDTTNTNYYNEHMEADNTTWTSARENSAAVNSVSGQNICVSCIIDVWLDPAGYFRYRCEGPRNNLSSVMATFAFGGKSSAPLTNITSLRISASQANAIKTGSKFTLETIY